MSDKYIGCFDWDFSEIFHWPDGPPDPPDNFIDNNNIAIFNKEKRRSRRRFRVGRRTCHLEK